MRTSISANSRTSRTTSAMRHPMVVFGRAVALGALTIFGAAVLGFGATPTSLVLVLALYLGASGIVAHGLQHHYPHGRLGLCNIVTFSRMVIVAVLVVVMMEGRAPDAVLLGLAIFSLGLDGVDGRLARREGLASGFGARFDVEVDAAFALTLALYAAATGVAAPYVVILGLPYYVFAAARHVWPWLGATLPASMARKAVCVAQIAVLIAILVPGIPGALLNTAIVTVIVALFWSFARDILWLYRGRHT